MRSIFTRLHVDNYFIPYGVPSVSCRLVYLKYRHEVLPTSCWCLSMRSINYFIKWNKYRGCSSIGRASALHAEGFAFKSRQLQLLCLRPTVGISTYPHEVKNQVDYYTLVYRRYKCLVFLFIPLSSLVLEFVNSEIYLDN